MAGSGEEQLGNFSWERWNLLRFLIDPSGEPQRRGYQ